MPIMVDGFPYTGAGMPVYMIENYRPGDPSIDSDANNHTNVDPFSVFETHLLLTPGVIPNQAIDSHPERVAGVMISDHPVFRGVAPAALLKAMTFTNSNGANRGMGEIANGMPTGGVDSFSSPNVHKYAAAATQSIVSGNSPAVQTIPVNLSFGLLGTSGFSFTNFLDWSSTTHNVLYVATAGNVGPAAGLNVPRNHFNGLTVGGLCNGMSDGSSCIPMPGVPYHRISPISLAPVEDGRRLVDLVAPGEDIFGPTTGVGDPFATSGGTSFAAPHAAGTVALLQQFANVQLGTPGFNTNAYQHQVMKAVLMNSADKLEDTGDGLLLDMEKTVLRSNDMDWIEQRAMETGRDAIPLDVELGTGALNARRAFRQFIPGEQDPGAVPNLGWDFETTDMPEGDDMPDSEKIYDLELPLFAGSYVAITLAWDRSVINIENESWGAMGYFNAEVFRDDGVTLSDGSTMGAHDTKFTMVTDPASGAVLTEPFIDLDDDDDYDHGLSETLMVDPLGGGLVNLDLYLMPTGSTDLGDAIALSNSTLYSEEHIFAQVPTTGLYSIWVRHLGTFTGELGRPYGLAWWTVPVPEPGSLALLALGLVALTWSISPRQKTAP